MTSDAMLALVNAWRGMLDDRPYVLPADRDVLEAFKSSTIHHPTFESYYNDPLFLLDDSRLHLGLAPLPYVGNLAKADVFLLMLNPGLSPGDYFAEQYIPSYKKRLSQQLNQTDDTDFLFLDPELSWHPGGQYWLSRFRDLALGLSESLGSVSAALQLMAKRVACLELVPYHSPRFGLGNNMVARLESVRLMQRYVLEDLWPRALRGEVLLVVTRQVQRWALTPSQNVILYDSAQARGGHISRAVPGGRAIFEFLKPRT